MAATLIANNKFWVCGECKEKGLQESRYCKTDCPFPFFEIDGDEYFRCPAQYVTAETIEILMVYQFYKDGFLPEQGGLYDQGLKIMDQIRIIGSVINAEQDEKWRTTKLR